MTRDEKGRFIKGHPGVGGRPTKEREQRYYELMLNTVNFDDWIIIIEKARDQAKRGDAQARKWLADYLIGPPVERKEITGADGGAIHVTLKNKDD